MSSSERIALVGGQVVPVTSEILEGGTVLIEDGVIRAVGDSTVPIPDGYQTVDVQGSWVLPGLVDAHTHIGTLEDSDGSAGDDHDEGTEPVTARIRAIDGVNPRDRAFDAAIAGGVLAVGINPGSCNPIGGQSAALRTYGRTVDDQILRSPCGVKSALGENPKDTYSSRGVFPSTRMGVAAVIRSALTRARDYLEDRPNQTDLDLEALQLVLERKIPWRQHVHREDDIVTALRLADEFGYDLVIDHGTESAELADVIAERGIPIILGPLIVGSRKVEMRNRSLRTAGILDQAGVRIAIATDHPVVPIQYLIHQATLAVKEGLDPDAALAAVTINPARILGVDDRIGSLEVGKDADLCVWSGDPLDMMSRVEHAFVQGRQVYQYDYDHKVGRIDSREWRA